MAVRSRKRGFIEFKHGADACAWLLSRMMWFCFSAAKRLAHLGSRPYKPSQRQSRNAIAAAFACILSGLTPGTLLSWSRLLKSPFCSR